MATTTESFMSAMNMTINSKIEKILKTQPRSRVVMIALIMTTVIGLIDWLTGYEFSSSIFYLIPISFCAWYVGASAGYAFCVLSAAVWIAADLASGHQYTSKLMPVWNTGVRLGFFIIVTILLKRLRVALDEQTFLAQVDGLTGLLNSRTFKQRGGTFFGPTSINGRPLALGYFDLDGFLNINNQLGHTAGDLVLKGVSKIISDRLRKVDVGGRVGGDEFAILLPDTDTDGARIFFVDLHKLLLKFCSENNLQLGFSIGVVVFNGFESSIDEAIGRADALMYKVKHSGKNRILIENLVTLPLDKHTACGNEHASCGDEGKN
jgi:diguanylate cyclase (GGDEF)-like protein